MVIFFNPVNAKLTGSSNCQLCDFCVNKAEYENMDNYEFVFYNGATAVETILR